jgi:Peptidase family M23
MTTSPLPPLPGRPDFRLPFGPGVVVELKTYVGHNPDDKKIDMYRAGMTTGSPIVASAAGVVHEHFDPGGIEIRHGGGWFTTYLHMSARVADGTRVKRGDWVGTMGMVGTHYPHLHYEQLYNPHSDQDGDNDNIVHALIQGTGPLVMNADHPITMVSTNDQGSGPLVMAAYRPIDPASAGDGRHWVDTIRVAPVFGSPTETTPTGTLKSGRNYVFGKVRGPEVRVGASYNHWWLKTDPDVGTGHWVSAYYLSRWGNDEAKDNAGNVIPDC